jgi:GTP-binding protein Era
MLDEALEAIREVDLRLLVLDVSVPSGGGDRFALDLIANSPAPRILLLNKIDLVEKNRLLPRLADLAKPGIFDEIVPVSAKSGDGLDRLPALLLSYLPEGEALYPADVVTMTDDRTRFAETIREKLLERTREEIPYGLGVVIENIEEREGKGLTVVTATVIVDRETHKGIVLGAGGRLIRDAGMAARLELEQVFQRKFYLDLTVAVHEGWREDPRFLSRLSS